MKQFASLSVAACAAVTLGLSGAAWARASSGQQSSTPTKVAAKAAAHSTAQANKKSQDAARTWVADTGPDPALARDPSMPDPPPTFKMGHSDSLTLQGFVSAVGFAQDQPYAIGNGTDGTWPIPVSPTMLNANGRITGGDVRDTRAQFIFAHQMDNGWTAGGFFSFDFYGGFNGSGIVSGQQPVPRLRLAFVSLKKGDTSFKFGQIPSLEEAMFPYSLAHMIFPLGFFWADGGWRYPGVGVAQKYPMSGGSTLTVSGQLLEGNYAGPGSTTNYETAGNAGFRPQYEGKVEWSGKTGGGSPYSFFVVGNYQKVNVTSVFGQPTGGPPPPENSFTSYNIILGAAFEPGPFSVKGEVFTDKAQANELYDYIQVGDIKDHGGWVQLGYKLPHHWGVYAGYFYASPNAGDVATWGGHYLKGQAGTLSLDYDEGTFAWGVEWVHNIQRYTDAGAESTIVANQLNLAAVYRF